MQHQTSIQHLSNEQLTAELARACRNERRSTISVLRLLAEVDRRRLYARLGYFSLYEYCTEELHYSENEAYLRIGVARAGRRFPVLLDMIERGELHLTGASRCAPQLTEENHRELLAAVVHKSKREIEEILACWFPQPDIEDSIDPASDRRQSVDPLAEGRYAVSFTATDRCCELLERAKQLSSHRRPRPGFGELIEEALEAYVTKLEKQKFKTTDRPREQEPAVESEDPRYVPARVKREVYQRDEGRCTFVGSDGRRCRARAFLEYDHVLPVARGGKSTAENLRLRCFRHNQHEAVEELGEMHVSLMADGFRPARILANRAALMAMRPLGGDSFRHELNASKGHRAARPERSEGPPS
jgi:5-methylcytosine-specific restriction endonuclease McrA